MRRILLGVAMIVVVAAASGCLRKEVVQTIYLGPSGAVWVVTESDVRSDEQDSADRTREEYAYAVAVSAGVHPIAEAFHRLGAQAVTTTWLRQERPYGVMTEARFVDVRQLGLSILDEVGAPGDVMLVREGCRTRLDARISLDQAQEKSDSPVHQLLSDLLGYRLTLTEGRFVAANGFEIREDGMVAVPDRNKAPDNGALTLSLTWEDEGCADVGSRRSAGASFRPY